MAGKRFYCGKSLVKITSTFNVLSVTQARARKENVKLDIPATVNLANLAKELGVETQAGKEALKIALENTILLDKKQLDYGSKNISRFAAFGCLVRMSDKFERLVHLYSNRRKRVANESILDSFRDFSNYAIIALLCEKGLWPTDDKTTNK